MYVRQLKHVLVDSLQGALELMEEGARNKAVSVRVCDVVKIEEAVSWEKMVSE